MFSTFEFLQDIGAMTSFVLLAIRPAFLLSLTFWPLQSDDTSFMSLTFWPTFVLLIFRLLQNNNEIVTVMIYMFFALGVALTTRPTHNIIVVKD